MTIALDAPRFAHPMMNAGRTGVGGEANVIVRKLSEARLLRHRTTSTPDLMSEIQACFAQRSEANWDGEGAEALRPTALMEALEFVQWLPESLPTPDVVPEPDGGIALEWYGAPHLAFIASFKGRGAVVYAGVFGQGNTVRGTEIFRNSIPNGLLELIRRVGEARNGHA